MTLKDDTCNSYSPGTVAKWLCLNVNEYGWTFKACFQKGQERGIAAQDIYEGLKRIVVETEAVDKAYREMMMMGIVPLPEWFYISCYYDYLNTCGIFNRDFSSETTMRWWMAKYLVEPRFQIKASPSVQEEFVRHFRYYIATPPQKPLVDRLADIFHKYSTKDFMTLYRTRFLGHNFAAHAAASTSLTE